MKRMLVAALSTCLLFTATAGAETFGPASPAAKPGVLTLGAGVFGSSFSYDIDNANFLDSKAKQLQGYLQLGYATSSSCETYLRLGMADLRIDNVFGNGRDFKADSEPYGTVGIKGLLRRSPNFDLGLILQGSYFGDYSDSSVIGGNIASLAVEKTWEANLGLVLQKELEGGILYGGPLAYIRKGDVTTNIGSASDEFEEENNLGGFVGVRWPLKNGVTFDFEAQAKSEVSGGAAVIFPF